MIFYFLLLNQLVEILLKFRVSHLKRFMTLGLFMLLSKSNCSEYVLNKLKLRLYCLMLVGVFCSVRRLLLFLVHLVRLVRFVGSVVVLVSVSRRFVLVLSSLLLFLFC